jgi:hypothetical protein
MKRIFTEAELRVLRRQVGESRVGSSGAVQTAVPKIKLKVPCLSDEDESNIRAINYLIEIASDVGYDNIRLRDEILNTFGVNRDENIAALRKLKLAMNKLQLDQSPGLGELLKEKIDLLALEGSTGFGELLREEKDFLPLEGSIGNLTREELLYRLKIEEVALSGLESSRSDVYDSAAEQGFKARRNAVRYVGIVRAKKIGEDETEAVIARFERAINKIQEEIKKYEDALPDGIYDVTESADAIGKMAGGSSYKDNAMAMPVLLKPVAIRSVVLDAAMPPCPRVKEISGRGLLDMSQVGQSGLTKLDRCV